MRRLKSKGDNNFIHWCDIDPEDFLQVYRQVVGVMSEAYGKTSGQLNGEHKDEEIRRILQEKNSKINRILRNKLESAATRYLISSIDRKPYTRHGLSLEAACITVHG